MTTHTLIASEYDHSSEHLRIEPSYPLDGKIFLGIEDHSLREHCTAGGRYVHIDADELRDAIDKAVGKREEPKKPKFYIAPAGAPAPAPGETLEEAGFKPLGWIDSAGLTFDEPKPAKPYRPIDRDRLLRHIEDLEATLTRRNERHERDQERIRELEAAVARMEFAKNEAERREGQLRTLTAREYLDLAWEAAHVPEDGKIHDGEEYISNHRGPYGQTLCNTWSGSPCDSEGEDYGFGPIRRRLLEPRPEPTLEERRQALIDEHELEDWEIELLAGAAA